MFKIAAPPIIAGSILCALQAATVPPASALDQWVELTNNTRMTIVEIYISRVGRCGAIAIDIASRHDQSVFPRSSI
jgi:hypothetical protein